jgi:hypothetical protein
MARWALRSASSLIRSQRVDHHAANFLLPRHGMPRYHPGSWTVGRGPGGINVINPFGERNIMCTISPKGGALRALPEDCQQQTLGIAFCDLSRLSEWTDSVHDSVVADFFQRYYRLVVEILEPAGCRIVKFMGDAALVVFEPGQGEQAIEALHALALSARQLGTDHGFDIYLNINVHVGSVLAGTFGPPGHERFDVIGKAVNVAALLGRRGMTLSAQAFRTLSTEGREKFNKHMPPITYRRPTG